MAVIKKFNFMAAGKPLMHIDLFGGSFDLYAPTKGLIEAFLEQHDKLIAVLERIAANPDNIPEDADVTVMDLYNIAAELISCNTDGVKVTGNDLLEKYEVSGEALIVFFHEYSDFIVTIRNQKN